MPVNTQRIGYRLPLHNLRLRHNRLCLHNGHRRRRQRVMRQRDCGQRGLLLLRHNRRWRDGLPREVDLCLLCNELLLLCDEVVLLLLEGGGLS